MKCLYLVTLLLLLSACGGGSSGTTENNPVGQAPTVSGHVVFPSINGQNFTATATVYPVGDLDHAVCRDNSAGETLDLPESCIEPDTMYWLHTSSRSFDKSLCAILSGADILQGDFQVNAMTDVLCQSLENFIRHTDPLSMESLDAHLQRVINLIVARDVDGLGAATRNDLATWQPGMIGYLTIDNYVVNKQHFNRQRSVPNSDIQLDTHLVGHIDTRYPAHRVVYQNGVAYVANDFSVSIIDVSAPQAPVLIASWPTGWIKDIEVFKNHLYIALGDAGIEKVDIANITQPQLAHYFAAYPAYKLSAGPDRVYFHAIDQGELLVAAINTDNTIDSIHIDDDYARQMTTLLKVLNGRIYSVTTAVTSTYITIFAADSLLKIGKYSLTQDYEQAELSVLTELFIHNRVNNTTDIVEVEDREILYLIIDPLLTKNTATGPVKPKFIVEVDLDNYALLAQSEANFFSLIEKYDVQVGRADGIMKIHHDFDFDDKDSTIVPMPEHVKMFYFDDTAAAELQENPLSAINSINSAPFQKRFQITRDERYSFFASDEYGFNIIKNK